MTLTADTHTTKRNPRLLTDLARVLWAHRPRAAAREEPVSTEDALVRALCHDMRSPLASLEATLGSLGRTPDHAAELLELARAQTAHLSSMLRTADATGGATRPSRGHRLLRDVVQAALAASDIPRSQVRLELPGDTGDIRVADARVQRILTNLLENAHRHGRGTSVLLVVSSRTGWVDLSLTQAGVPTDRVVGHLRTVRPPVDLAGLGLWSVRRQTYELGGQLVWDDDGTFFTLTIQLPDR